MYISIRLIPDTCGSRTFGCRPHVMCVKTVQQPLKNNLIYIFRKAPGIKNCRAKLQNGTAVQGVFSMYVYKKNVPLLKRARSRILNRGESGNKKHYLKKSSGVGQAGPTDGMVFLCQNRTIWRTNVPICVNIIRCGPTATCLGI